ncbi:C13 family peptidase [Collimonas pratensis]|uniref:Caspase domain protein n=1 Tax=Collimonas pratensis TaxID=279113 RepID=A0ABM5Z588_9BURK|nr:C13 family peptidase [Collimonas pratensis]AMP14309.1 caspase domain protein [Collimonas pratensis]
MHCTKAGFVPGARGHARTFMHHAALFVIAAGLAIGAANAAVPDAVTPDGGQYYGPLVDGKLQGKGKIRWTNGNTYEGNFEKGLFSGNGEMHFEKGSKYKGDFVNGRFQGKGRFDLAGGEYYAGEFSSNEFTGYGVHQGKNGVRQAGTFKKWQLEGPGRLSDAAGNTYEGIFTDGKLNQPGRYISKDGGRYEGDFKDGKLDGMGIYRSADGDEYKGSFAHNRYNGGGILTYASPQKDGHSKDIGIWSYGTLVDEAADRQSEANVETALYGQRALLDKTLATIAPHAPGKINLYLLAVAGDGSQEVFRRETAFVRTQFDRDFGTQGRSMVLVNSRNTVAEQPMATVTSIRESLNAIAAKMDKENDILFLYLSSHGSQSHELSLAQNGMTLRNLEAKELAKLLAATGIRWKVVVVSACYAGGFIDPLKDAHTMVIAAARRDRTSFGCADDNDFTYFGRAFFQKSVPASASFSEAFDKAKALVTAWEADDTQLKDEDGEILHSEPQIYHNAAIDAYLKKWRAQATAPATHAAQAK